MTPRNKTVSSLALAFLAVGSILIVLSLVWPRFATGRSQWSDQQARQYQAISAEFHSLSHEMVHHSDDDDVALAQRHREAQEEFDSLHSQLESARQSPARMATVMQILGSLLVVAGAVLYYLGWR